MSFWEEIKKQLWGFLRELFASLISDKYILGKYLQQRQAGVAQPPGAPTGAPPAPELVRGVGGAGFSDEAAIAMAYNLELAEAREIAWFYTNLERFNQDHFESALSTVPTAEERTRILRQLVYVPRADMFAVAATFQLVKLQPSLIDQAREWLRQNLPLLGPQLQQQLQNWTAGLTNRTAAIQARRQGRQQAHVAGQQFAWDPQTQHANMNPIRRFIRIITGL